MIMTKIVIIVVMKIMTMRMLLIGVIIINNSVIAIVVVMFSIGYMYHMYIRMLSLLCCVFLCRTRRGAEPDGAAPPLRDGAPPLRAGALGAVLGASI